MTYNTTKWSEGLKFVASQKNASLHRGIGRSPYEAVFGVPLRMGLSSVLPDHLLDKLNTEEDVEEFLRKIRLDGQDSTDTSEAGGSPFGNRSPRRDEQDSTDIIGAGNSPFGRQSVVVTAQRLQRWETTISPTTVHLV